MPDNMQDKGGYYTRAIVNHAKRTQRVQCYELASLYDFAWGNVVKYLWRWRGKNGVEDLNKALDYATTADGNPCPYAYETVREIIYGLIEAGGMYAEETEAWLSILEENKAGACAALDRLIARANNE